VIIVKGLLASSGSVVVIVWGRYQNPDWSWVMGDPVYRFALR